MSKKIIIAATFLFFAVMLFLTFTAETIHNCGLPEITASRPEMKLFPVEYALDDGTVQTGTEEKLAISEEMLKSGVYVVYSAEKNGTKRDFVRLVSVQTGERTDGYVEVVSGIGFGDRIVTSGNEGLYNMCEVKEKWNTNRSGYNRT